MRIVFDIEANGWRDETTNVWCLVTYNLDTKEKLSFRPHEIEKGISILQKATLIIGHNIINYDIPLLERLYKTKITAKVYDTLVMSRLANPDRLGGHSLKAWGKRLGRLKGDFAEDEDENVWAQFSEEMLTYCENDVAVNILIYHRVVKELEDFSPLSQDIEHGVARIITQQEINGVRFDKEKANGYVKWIDEECGRLYALIRPKLSMDVVDCKPLQRIFKKDGSYHTPVVDWMAHTGIQEVSGPFTRIEWEEPDIGSRTKMIKQLLRLGWKPEEFTDKGTPKLTTKNEYNETVPVDSLEETLGELGSSLSKYYILRHRQSQIAGFLKNLRPDGKIVAGAITNGTNTARMTHRIVANLPRATSYFGKEMRSLFKVSLGADLSGLELRTLAHRMRDDVYTRKLLEEDIHTVNQLAAGLPTRDNAKTFIYGFLYGAGDAKIGKIVNGNAARGKQLKERFLKGLPALAKLIDAVKHAAKKGYLIGLDGRKVWLRKGDDGKIKTHTALNALLQSDGAIIFKVALLFIDKLILQRIEGTKLLISYHDEVQIECKEGDEELVGKKIIECFEKAGTFLKVNCPITGEYSVGENWSETH